jgi:hypothetical protein
LPVAVCAVFKECLVRSMETILATARTTNKLPTTLSVVEADTGGVESSSRITDLAMSWPLTSKYSVYAIVPEISEISSLVVVWGV